LIFWPTRDHRWQCSFDRRNRFLNNGISVSLAFRSVKQYRQLTPLALPTSKLS
jgi:hypothetical protein